MQFKIGTLVCHAGPAHDISVSGEQASQEPSSSHRKPSSMGSYHRSSLQQVRRADAHALQSDIRMHRSHCDNSAIRAALAVLCAARWPL